MEREILEEMFTPEEFWVIETPSVADVVTYAFNIKPRTGDTTGDKVGSFVFTGRLWRRCTISSRCACSGQS